MYLAKEYTIFFRSWAYNTMVTDPGFELSNMEFLEPIFSYIKEKTDNANKPQALFQLPALLHHQLLLLMNCHATSAYQAQVTVVWQNEAAYKQC